MSKLHQTLVMTRRIQRLSAHLVEHLAPLGPVTCLDVGCGSGEVAAAVMSQLPDVTMKGIDVLVRPDTTIPVEAFDGLTIPYEENSFDVVTLVDVLHHTEEQQILLNECRRVARKMVLIKDHVCESGWDTFRLRFMDWVGNSSHGVALPYLYLSRAEWNEISNRAGLSFVVEKTKLDLYPFPFSLIFDGNLHCLYGLTPDIDPAHGKAAEDGVATTDPTRSTSASG